MKKNKVLKRGPIQAATDWVDLTDEELAELGYGERGQGKQGHHKVATNYDLAAALALAQIETNERFG